MVRTMTVLWIGLVWLTLVQAQIQINSMQEEEYEDLDVRTELDANMTIKEVSMHWIEVYYDIDDSTVMVSFIIYDHGADVDQVPCPPSISQRSGGRMTYWCRVADLQMCTSYDLHYHYWIPSNDSNVATYHSDLLGVLTAADESIPVSNLTCKTSSPGTLILEWYNPFPKECSIAFDVSWEGKASWDADLFEMNSTTMSGHSFTLNEVIPEAEYTFNVTVQFQGNNSGQSASITCNTLAEPSSAPFLTVADAGTSFLYLSWEAPAAVNGLLQGYELNWTDEAGTTLNKRINVMNVYNLTENVLACSVYQVALAAVNAAGLGARDTKPGETLQKDIGDLACEVTSDSSVLVSWTAAPANCGRNGTSLSWHGESLWDQYYGKIFFKFLGGEADSFTLTELHPYTVYDICVTLMEDWANQSCSQATTRQGVPDAPAKIETSSTKSSIHLNWEETTSWNGIASNYLIQCLSANVTEDMDANTTEYTIIGLAEGTEYTVSVQACNEEQCSIAEPTRVKTEGGGSNTQDSNTGLIVGLTLGSVAVVAAVVAGLVVRARRKRRTEEESHEIAGSVSSLSSM